MMAEHPHSILLAALAAAVAAVCYFATMYYFPKRRRKNDKIVLAFFHPHCDSGGGGERVLWVMVEALLREEALSNRLKIVIYASKGENCKGAILASVKDSFRIDVSQYSDRLSFVCVSSTSLLDAKWYPVATMLFQSVASIIVGLECIIRHSPDIYCDTMGAAFTYPLAKALCGCLVVTYTHYPIISSDMLQRVREQRPSHNNDRLISGSVSISAAKLLYYRMFASAYSFVGSFADLVMVNSSWTEGHICRLWRLNRDSKGMQPDNATDIASPSDTLSGSACHGKALVKLYPPCNTTHLQGIPLGDISSRRRVVLSVGQFRPEKDHLLQLR